MKYVKLFEQYLNEIKLYTNYGDYNTEDNIQKLKDLNIKFPTEEEFTDLIESNCITQDKISMTGIQKSKDEIISKYGKDFDFVYIDHPPGYSVLMGKNCGSLFSLFYNPFSEKSSYQGCIYVYEVK